MEETLNIKKDIAKLKLRICDSSRIQTTKNWYCGNHSNIRKVFNKYFNKGGSISSFLEIGSFEGLSTVGIVDSLIDKNQTLKKVHCIDTWNGSVEFQHQKDIFMSEVQKRFENNFEIVKDMLPPNAEAIMDIAPSVIGLSKLIIENAAREARGQEPILFDLIYVDASHTAYDALTDMCLAFKLLAPGGLLLFDDYMWELNDEPTQTPKIGFDAFAACFAGQFKYASLKNVPLYQMYITKNK